MPAHEQKPVAGFVPRILLAVAFSERMTDLMVGQCLRDKQGLITRLLQAEGEVQVFGAERVENHVESAKLLEHIGAHHHGPATGNARPHGVVLPEVYLPKPDRSYSPEQIVDPGPAAVVEPCPVMHEAEFGLGLPNGRTIPKGLE